MFVLQFLESQFTLRSSTTHARHCAILDNEELMSADRQHYSTTFGVNRRALVDTLCYFDVTSGALIPDIMHDILEGALPLEVKCLLKVLVHVLHIFNCVLTSFCYYMYM